MDKFNFYSHHSLAAGFCSAMDPSVASTRSHDQYKEYILAGCNILCVDMGIKDSSIFLSPDDAVRMVGDALAPADLLSRRDDVALALVLPSPKGSEKLGFDEIYDYYATLSIAADNDSADMIVLREADSLYHMKAALIAVKENSNLPVVAMIMWDGVDDVRAQAEAACLSSVGADFIGLYSDDPADTLFSKLKACRKVTPSPIFLCIGPSAATSLSIENLITVMEEIGVAAVCSSNKDTITKFCRHFPKASLDKDPGCGLCCITTDKTVVPLNDYCLIGLPQSCPPDRDAIDWAISEMRRLKQEGADAFVLSTDDLSLLSVEKVSQAVLALQQAEDMPLVIQTDNLTLAEAALWAYIGRPGFLFYCQDISSLQPFLDLSIRFGATFLCSTCGNTSANPDKSFNIRMRHYTTGMFVDIWRFRAKCRICDAAIGTTFFPDHPAGDLQEVLASLRKDFLRLNVTTFCNSMDTFGRDPATKDVESAFLIRAMDTGCRTFLAKSGLCEIHNTIENYQKTLFM